MPKQQYKHSELIPIHVDRLDYVGCGIWSRHEVQYRIFWQILKYCWCLSFFRLNKNRKVFLQQLIKTKFNERWIPLFCIKAYWFRLLRSRKCESQLRVSFRKSWKQLLAKREIVSCWKRVYWSINRWLVLWLNLSREKLDGKKCGFHRSSICNVHCSPRPNQKSLITWK